MTDSILTNDAPVVVADGVVPYIRELDITVPQMLSNIDTKNVELQRAIAFLKTYFESHYTESFSSFVRHQCAMYTQEATD